MHGREEVGGTEAGARRVLLFWDGGLETAPAVAGRRISVGRSARCDLVLAGPTVSRIHAYIHVEPEERGARLEDLGSLNGTWVGTKRLGRGDSVPLAGRTVLRLGDTEVIVQLAGRQRSG